jgi:TfoX/Sxy family transcriptional regulator of competence genes
LGLHGHDEELADRLREQLAEEAGVTEKAMFGGLAFLVNGNMTVAASGRGGLMVRVGANAVDDVLSRSHVKQIEMRGRPMTGWIHVASEGVRTRRQLGPWVRRSLEFVRTLPPKG